jgi:broad specificity phosphatase PhoE
VTLLAAPTADEARLVPALGNPVWLIRHAPTSWTGRRWCGRADPPLSRAGRDVARGLAATVAGGFTLGTRATIRSSPARRARSTAAVIAKVTGWPIVVDDDLLEVDVGVVEGLTWGELSTAHPALAADLERGTRVDWPGGETSAAVRIRAARAAAAVLEAAVRTPVLVVSHGALLHALVDGLPSPPATDGDPPPFFAPGGILRLAPESAP